MVLNHAQKAAALMWRGIEAIVATKPVSWPVSLVNSADKSYIYYYYLFLSYMCTCQKQRTERPDVGKLIQLHAPKPR